MKQLSSFINSIIGGMCISIGGIAFLSLDNKVVGSIFFCVGLFTICTFGYNLFTGKVCYVFENKPKYALWTLTVWLGNLIGTALVGTLVRLTRILPIAEKAQQMCQTKMDDSLLSLFILGIFCNILIFIAVDGFKNNKHELGKYLSLFFGVTVFIICGTEHCVADMFYFAVAGIWTGKALLCIIVISLGNTVGGVLFPLCRMIAKKAEEKKNEEKVKIPINMH